MRRKEYEYLVVGSGAAGATLARELAKRGRPTAVIERGPYPRAVGKMRHAFRYFERGRLSPWPRRTVEGTILWRAIVAGGSTVMSCANATRCLETELEKMGINIRQEAAEAERELGVCPTPTTLLSESSNMIMDAADALGHTMRPMPKFIRADRCSRCGRCVLGCPNRAKWSALEYLEDAVQHGAELICDTTVLQVLVEQGTARGVMAKGADGTAEISAERVVLCSGGLGTPSILQRSGITEAGTGLFADLFVNTCGVMSDGLRAGTEPVMGLVCDRYRVSGGFILSPFVNYTRTARFVEFGPGALRLPSRGLVGIMTKIADEPVGRVEPGGRAFKPVTPRDRERLKAGSSLAKEILVKAGVDERSLVLSSPQGAHPGGTAAIGKIVDTNLETAVRNLFVCDASVLPLTPGLPPIVTIVALAKRLAGTLAGIERSQT